MKLTYNVSEIWLYINVEPETLEEARRLNSLRRVKRLIYLSVNSDLSLSVQAPLSKKKTASFQAKIGRG